MTSFTAEEASRINKKNKMRNRWKKFVGYAVRILIPFVLMGYFYLDMYHSMNALTLRTTAVKALCSQVEARYEELDDIKVRYRAVGVVIFECRAENWTEDRAKKLAEDICAAMQDQKFQSEYAEKHGHRYKNVDPELQFAVIEFVDASQEVSVFTWTSSRPFDGLQSAQAHKFG